MCPATIASMSSAAMFAASLGVSALTTGINYVAQQQNAEAQIEAQERNLKAQSEAATTAMVRSTEDLQQRELQERASTALRVNNARLRTEEAKAKARTSTNATGLSMETLMTDYDREYQSFASAQYQQLGFATDQIDRQREGLMAQAEGRINSVPRSPVSGPSLGGSLANFGSQALSSYGTFATRDPKTGDFTLT